MPESYIETYYSQTLYNDTPRPVQEGDVEADVCVIGGGLAGVNTALGLAERGVKVVLLESRRIGHGASGRNGGFCMGGYAGGAEVMADIAKKLGMEHARSLYRLTKEAQTLIRERINKLSIPCDPVDGQLVVSWQKPSKDLRESAEYLSAHFDEKVEFWSKDKVRAHYKTQRYDEGVLFTDWFHMHPLNYLTGIAKAAEGKGAVIYEGSPALRVEYGQGTVHRVYTAQGCVSAGQIVFCGSAYFNKLERRLSNACLPVATYIMVTEAMEKERLESAICAPYAIHDTRFAYDYYRPLPDHSILWGGRVGLKKEPSPEALKKIMMGDLLKVYPQLEGIKAKVAWSGLMGYSVHKMPHIGMFGNGVWYCTNFGGGGVGPTTAGGEVIAAAIADGDERYKLFKPFGFPWTGGPLGPLVAQAIYYGWEIKDCFNEWRTRKQAA